MKPHLIGGRPRTALEVAEAGSCALDVEDEIAEDEPGLDEFEGVGGGALGLIEEVPSSTPPGVGLGGGTVFIREVEMRRILTIPEEGAGGAKAEYQGGGTQVDLLPLAQPRVDVAHHGLDGRGVYGIGDVKISVVDVVLQERQCVLAIGQVYTTDRRICNAGILATGCDAEGEGATVVQGLSRPDGRR